MILRKLNNSGLDRMNHFLDSLITDAPLDYPAEVLSEDEFSEALEVEVEVEDREFVDREEVGSYLVGLFANSGLEGVERDQGLWVWLSLFYFHQLCPKGKDGRFSPGARARWIPAFSDYKRYYRHLLFGPYKIYLAYQEDPSPVRGLLCNHPSSPGDFTEQLASRQELVTNKAVMEVSRDLYVDSETNQPKRGARGSKPGSVRRLAMVLGQFDMTWDLYSMESNSIQEMLPEEFARFRS